MKKRWAVISLAVAMALLCTGCFPTGVQVKGDISITDPAELKNLPDHYREQLSDRLLVNADIIVPEDATYHIYKAQLRKPDVETWVDLCYGDRLDQIRLVNDDAATNPSPYAQTIYTHDGEGSVLNLSGTIINFAKRFQYREYMLCTNFTNYKDDSYLPMSSFFKKETVPDVDKQEALATAKNFVEQLQLPLESEPSVYAFDEEELNQLSDRYAGDFTRYNEEEQGYFISYRALVDNVPVYDFNYTPPNQDIVSGSYLGLAYTNYGLDEVWTGGFYETTECVQEDVDLISLESALSSVQTYLEEMVDMGPILINKAELCYLPITNDVDGNDFTLQPTWVIDTYVFMQEVDWSKVQDLEDIMIEQDSIDVLAFSYKPYFIDATTGKMVLS